MNSERPSWAGSMPSDKDYGGEDIVGLALAIQNEQIVGWRDITTELYRLLAIHREHDAASLKARLRVARECLENIEHRWKRGDGTASVTDLLAEVRKAIFDIENKEAGQR